MPTTKQELLQKIQDRCKEILYADQVIKTEIGYHENKIKELEYWSHEFQYMDRDRILLGESFKKFNKATSNVDRKQAWSRVEDALHALMTVASYGDDS
jgi:hypothetical protein